jgi:hypothetical protein
MGLVVGARAGERGQEGVVDVDDPIAELIDELGTDESSNTAFADMPSATWAVCED